MLGVSELIAACLNGQWRIPLISIIDEHIGVTACVSNL
jgi:hypothetical protein